jgi:hypothetical protein
MRLIYWSVAVLLMTAVSFAQEGDQKAQATEGTGQKTVTGCIAYGAPSGFILKTDAGEMIPLRTTRDLSPYVGKKVQIQASWTRTGITMAEGETGQEGSGAEAKPGVKAPMTFAGAMRMQYKGKVLGDCK